MVLQLLHMYVIYNFPLNNVPFWRRINLWYFFQVEKNIIVIVEFFKNCIYFRDKNVSFEEPHWTASSKSIIDFNEIFSIKEIKDDSPSNAIKRLSWTFYAPWQVAMISFSYRVQEMKVSFILISRGSLGGAFVLKCWTPQ